MIRRIKQLLLLSIALLLVTNCQSVGHTSSPRPGHHSSHQSGHQPAHTLQVTASAYNSLPGQTRGNPSLGAWGDRLKPGMKVIAVSRDLIRLGLRHNMQVKIDGLSGTYLVKDKMNKRWSRKIDIYMGRDVKAARRWGKRRVTIHW